MTSLNQELAPHQIFANAPVPDVASSCAAARNLISNGHPRRAYDLIRDALRHHSEDPELTYLAALSLARGKNAQAAERTATDLLSRKELPLPVRADTLSLLGRLLKEKCRTAQDAERRELASRSATAYEQAFHVNPVPFPAINAASMWRLAGDLDRSQFFALEVLKQTESLVGHVRKAEDYWTMATLGEANLLLDRQDAARAFYASAVRIAANRVGDIASMQQQVLLLADVVPGAKAILDEFQTGTVVVFSGHLIDHQEREDQGLAPRFPRETALEATVREQIRKQLRERNCRVGYSSAACGSDLLFAEEALARGMELHIVLPFALEDFYRTSVDFGDPAMAGWRERCDAVLAAAAEVSYATRERYLDDNLLFRFANHVLQGLAINRAAELNTEPIALAVLSTDVGAMGGTRDFIETWQKLGLATEIIALEAERSTETKLVRVSPREEAGHRELKAMLFADVRGFSKLQEEQTLKFFYHFLKTVADCLDSSSSAPIFKNTWGDGLFLVFEDPPACADFAITLCERIATTDFALFGLPTDMAVRIGIHTGPVFRHMDPVLLKENFCGSHVNRAARIEPVTMPGCVYASEQMASLLALSATGRFRCEYVGKEELAKSFDNCSLFHVLRKPI